MWEGIINKPRFTVEKVYRGHRLVQRDQFETCVPKTDSDRLVWQDTREIVSQISGTILV